ncbi:MAG: hypothetical protein P8P85_12825 [Acidimicrobiales bacterium]|nr:hypothetical protein [Acidimicrobiales bacterium]
MQTLADTAFDVFEDLLNEVDQKAAKNTARMAAADGFAAAEQPESTPLCAEVGKVLLE